MGLQLNYGGTSGLGNQPTLQNNYWGSSRPVNQVSLGGALQPTPTFNITPIAPSPSAANPQGTWSSLSGISTAPAQGGFMNWMNTNSAGLGMAFQGIGTIANIYGGLQQLKQNKEAFNWQKSVGETNLANSIKSYNTQLADRAASRGKSQGWSQEQVDEYVKSNQLSR